MTWDTSLSHKVKVATVGGFAASRLGADPTAELSVPDWLILTGQSVLEVIAGPVFTDHTRELAPARARLTTRRHTASRNRIDPAERQHCGK